MERCVECGEETNTYFEILNIPLCGECRENEKYALITKTRAMQEFCLSEKELNTLKKIEVDNPHYKVAAPMKLFLKSQVEEISSKKWGSKEALAQEIQRRVDLGDKIIEGKANARNKREVRLSEALEKKGLYLREDSRLCSEYIGGKVKESIDKIVDVMVKAHIRHTETSYDELWEKYRYEIQEDVEEAYCEYGNWADAWRITIAEWKSKIKKEAFEKKGDTNIIKI